MTNQNTKAIEALEKVKEWAKDACYCDNDGEIVIDLSTTLRELDRLIEFYKGAK